MIQCESNNDGGYISWNKSYTRKENIKGLKNIIYIITVSCIVLYSIATVADTKDSMLTRYSEVNYISN
jgi:hypothetical protein